VSRGLEESRYGRPRGNGRWTPTGSLRRPGRRGGARSDCRGASRGTLPSFCPRGSGRSSRPPPRDSTAAPSGPRPGAEATAELGGRPQPRGLGDAEPTDPIHLLNFTVRDLSQGAEGGEERLSLVGAVGPGTLDPKEEAQALGVRQRLGLFGHEALARQSSLGHSRIVGRSRLMQVSRARPMPQECASSAAAQPFHPALQRSSRRGAPRHAYPADNGGG